MEDSTRIASLLEEIRDLQKTQLEEYTAHAARSVALAEESVDRQRRFGNIYKRVLIVGALLIAALVYFVLWPALSGQS
jgi:type VI protein secretion system component VasF